jgi:hypothetical protein
MALDPQNLAHSLSNTTVTGDTMAPTHPSLTIRSARGSDGAALDRLARLDSQRVPSGDVLVATAAGEIVAAYGVERGTRIGDPFRPTADVLDLLELHAARLTPRKRERGDRRRDRRPALRFSVA